MKELIFKNSYLFYLEAKSYNLEFNQVASDWLTHFEKLLNFFFRLFIKMW